MRTETVRKAYILQYAPEGAVVLEARPGGAPRRRPANDPKFQYPLLCRGEPV